MGILSVLRVLTHIWRSEMQHIASSGFLLRTASTNQTCPPSL